MTLPAPAKRILGAVSTVVVLTACGATPPQAPLKEAKKLSTSTGGISTACGVAYQASAFPGPRKKDLEPVEAMASSSARKLASVYIRNQGWIYQGETVREIVRDALSMLDACGLTKAQSVLAQATYARRRATSR